MSNTAPNTAIITAGHNPFEYQVCRFDENCDWIEA